MKNGLLILNVVLLAAVAVLFYLHFSGAKAEPVRVAGSQVTAGSATPFRIAYFEMDSITNSFDMVKEVRAELSKREDAISNELGRLEREYRNKAVQYQEQAQKGMNQTQSEMAQRDMMQTEEAIRGRKQQLEGDYQEFQMRKQQDIRARIESFLKEYNRNKNFTYIVSYEPGLFFYKDTAYNITGDLIKGLNAAYKKK